MLSNFFRHDDPFDMLSNRIDDIFAGFEGDSLSRPSRRFVDDFGFDLEDEFWERRMPRRERRHGGFNDDLRDLAFSMRRQMQDMQRMFERIEDRLGDPALKNVGGTHPPLQKQQHQQHQDLPSSEAIATDNSSPNQPTTTTAPPNNQPWYKIVKQEKHYTSGSDPSNRSYFMRTEVNDNGHVRVKTAEKRPGEKWQVDTKEYNEPSQRVLRSEGAHPQGQIEGSHSGGEQLQSQSQIKENKEAGSEKKN